MKASAILEKTIVGTIRRFGKKGILYEIVDELDKDTVLIRVLETGEATRYPKSHALKDPTE